MAQAITSKNFNTKLSSFLSSAKTQRDNLQALLAFGVEHYGTNGDTVYLNKVIQGCVGVRSIPTVTIKDYIKAHANVVYVKLKDGKLGFKKESKKVDAVIKEFSSPWYEWEGGKHNATRPDSDALNLLKALSKKLEAGKGIKKNEHLDSVKQGVADLLTELQLAGEAS